MSAEISAMSVSSTPGTATSPGLVNHFQRLHIDEDTRAGWPSPASGTYGSPASGSASKTGSNSIKVYVEPTGACTMEAFELSDQAFENFSNLALKIAKPRSGAFHSGVVVKQEHNSTQPATGGGHPVGFELTPPQSPTSSACSSAEFSLGTPAEFSMAPRSHVDELPSRRSVRIQARTPGLADPNMDPVETLPAVDVHPVAVAAGRSVVAVGAHVPVRSIASGRMPSSELIAWLGMKWCSAKSMWEITNEELKAALKQVAEHYELVNFEDMDMLETKTGAVVFINLTTANVVLDLEMPLEDMRVCGIKALKSGIFMEDAADCVLGRGFVLPMPKLAKAIVVKFRLQDGRQVFVRKYSTRFLCLAAALRNMLPTHRAVVILEVLPPVFFLAPFGTTLPPLQSMCHTKYTYKCNHCRKGVLGIDLGAFYFACVMNGLVGAEPHAGEASKYTYKVDVMYMCKHCFGRLSALVMAGKGVKATELVDFKKMGVIRIKKRQG